MKKRNTILFLLLFLLIVFPWLDSLRAFERKVQKGPVNIEADSITYDSNLDTYRAHGNVIVTFTGGYLKADSVTMNKTTKDAATEGHVEIRSEEDLLRCDSAQFNVETKTGTLHNGTIFFDRNHFYLSGKEIEKKGEDTYSLKDVTATTCDGDRPDWRFTGQEIDVTVDGYGTMKHGTFEVSNIPVIYVPWMVFPAKTTRQSGLLFPRIAYSRDKHGWDIEVPFFWAISESTDATLYQRYMDKRGLQEGLEFRYCISENSYGTFYGDYLNDAKAVSETEGDGLLRNWSENQKRWSYYLNHETTFSPGFYIRTDIKKVSDNWYFKDFDLNNYYLEHYGEGRNKRFDKVSFVGDKSLASLESTARVVKEWDLFNLTALAQYTDNFQSYSNDTTLQKYPEVTFTGITQPLFDSPVYFELESTYDYYYRTRGYKGHLFDAHPIFSLPLTYSDYFQFTPEIGFHETKWDGMNTEDGVPGKRGSRELYDIGATLSTEVHRIFSVNGQTVEKVRHGVKPEVSYTYIPYVYQADLADFVGTIPEQNSVTYSLTNTLTARVKDSAGGISYREFFNLKVSQPYNIKEAQRNLSEPNDTRRPFGNVAIEFDFNPFQYLSLDSDASYDVNDGEWKKTNCNFAVSDGRGDSVSVEYRYTQDQLEEINLSLDATVTKTLDFKYVIRRNVLDKKYLESTYAIDYHKQCWSVGVSYSDTSDDRSYMIIFSLYGLGKVGRVGGETSSITRNF
ncbi:MAG: LPS-assembly protein LptD [Deltaproteobacteria bacterium]|nr:LPS-assembly protein LptD [Deltaproteobacteria bacterium]